MTITDNRPTARRWCRRAAAGVGAAIGASAVAVGLSAGAHADAIADVLAAAQIPLDTAQAAIAEAPATLSAAETIILSGQNQILDAQGDFLTMLQTAQESLNVANPADFADLDKLLYSASESLLYHTTAFLSAAELDGPIAEFFTGADLFNADLSAYVTDFEVIIGSIATGYFGSSDLSGLLLS